MSVPEGAQASGLCQSGSSCLRLCPQVSWGGKDCVRELFVSPTKPAHGRYSASIRRLLPGASAHGDKGTLVGRCWDSRGMHSVLLSPISGPRNLPWSGIISPSPVCLARPCPLPCTPSPPTPSSFSLLNPLIGLGQALSCLRLPCRGRP